MRSMIATSGAVARTVTEFCVLLATNDGTIGEPCTRPMMLSSCTISCASECDRKKVRMTCSSYFARFWTLSGMTRIVRSLSTL